MVEAETGPLKATVVPFPTDCGLTVPERRKVSEEEAEPGATRPAQPQRNANNGSTASGTAWHFRRLLDFGSAQPRAQYIEKKNASTIPLRSQLGSRGDY